MSAIVVEPDPMPMEAPALPKAEPCVIVIFGATGDLTRRKLMPALWNLKGQGCLESVRMLGVGRTAMSDDEFRALVREALVQSEKINEHDEETWRKFAQRIHYLSGELGDD